MKGLNKTFLKSFFTHFLYILILLGIIAFTIFGDSGLYYLHSMYKSKTHLEYSIKESQNRIIHLEEEKKRLANPDYLEAIIRDDLGYIKKGEKVYQLTP